MKQDEGSANEIEDPKGLYSQAHDYKEEKETINQLLVDKLELVIMLQEFIEAMQSKRSLLVTIEKAQAMIAKHSPK